MLNRPRGRNENKNTLAALPSVNATYPCEHCGRPFRGRRRTQRYCTPSCRVRACRQRRSSDLATLLASGIAAGYVASDVLSD